MRLLILGSPLMHKRESQKMMAREASPPGGSFFDDEPLPKPKAKAA